MSAGTIDVARIRAIFEAENAAQAAQQIRNFGAQIDQASSAAQRSGGGFAALNQHSKTAYERAQIAGQRFQEMSRSVEDAGRKSQSAASSVERVGKAADDAGKKAGQAAKDTGMLGGVFGEINPRSLLAAAGIASVGVTAVNTGKQMIQAGVDYEMAFAGVQKTVDATTAEMEALDSGIRNMAMEIPASAVAIAGVAEAAGQLGIEVPNILNFTRVMTDLGVATNMSAEQAATSLARLANITQMPQENFDRLGSTVVELGNNLATTEAEIVEMGLRIAAAGTQIGLTEAEVLGFAGALSSLGVEAQAGGTAISRVMIDVANAVAMGGEKLALFAETAGMSEQQFRQLFQEDAALAIITFVEGLDAVAQSGGNVFAVLEELGLQDIRVRDALLRMAGGGDILRASIDMGNDAWRENIALTKEAELFYGTTANQWQIIKNTLNEVALSIFAVGQETGATTTLLEGMSDTALGILRVAGAISDVNDAVRELPEVLPWWLQPESGIEVVERGWVGVGAAINNAVRQSLLGPGVAILASLGDSAEDAGEEAGKKFTDAFFREIEKPESRSRTPEETVDSLLGQTTLEDVERIFKEYGDKSSFAFWEGVSSSDMSALESWIDNLSAAFGTDEMGEELGIIKDLRAQYAEMAAERERYIGAEGQAAKEAGEVLGNLLVTYLFPSNAALIEQRDLLQQTGQGFIEYGNVGEIALTGLENSVGRVADAFAEDPELGAQFVERIALGIMDGEVRIRDAATVLAGVPRDVVMEQLQAVRADLKGQWVEALLSGEDITEIERRMGLVEDLMAEFPAAVLRPMSGGLTEFNTIGEETVRVLNTAGMGFSEFSTTGEAAMFDVTMAAHGLRDAVEGLSGAYSIGLDVQSQFNAQGSEYAGQLGTIEKAYEAVLEKQEAGIELTETEIMVLQHGEAAMDTFTRAQHDSTVQAGAAAIANAELVEAQWELNRAIADGEEDLTPYLDRVQDAEQFARDMGVATDGNTTAQGLFVQAINKAVEKLQELIEKLAGTPEKVSIDLELRTAGALEAFRSFMETVGGTNPNAEVWGSGFTQGMADGGISTGGVYLVGEEGPELAFLPAGTHVIPNDESMRILGGLADGTDGAPELTDLDRQALQLFGDLHVALHPDSVQRVQDELAGLLEAREVAESLGMGEAVIASIDADIAAKQSELDLIGQVSGTAVGAAIVQGIENEINRAEFDEAMEAKLAELELAVDDAFNRFGAATSEGVGQTGQMLADQIEAAQEAIDLAILQGEDWSVIERMMGDRDELVAQFDQLMRDVAVAAAAGLLSPEAVAAFAEAGGAQFEAYMEEISGPGALDKLLPAVQTLGEESIGQLAEVFAAWPETVGGHLDDLVEAVQDGGMEIADLFMLLGDLPEDAVLPALERLEDQYRNGLIEAIIAGNADAVESFEELLDIIMGLQGELEEVESYMERMNKNLGGGLPSSGDLSWIPQRIGGMPQVPVPQVSAGGFHDFSSKSEQQAFLRNLGIGPITVNLQVGTQTVETVVVDAINGAFQRIA